MKDSPLQARVVVRTSNMKISRRHLADTSKNCTTRRAARAARLFSPIQPMKSLFCGVDVAVAGAISKTRNNNKKIDIVFRF